MSLDDTEKALKMSTSTRVFEVLTSNEIYPVRTRQSPFVKLINSGQQTHPNAVALSSLPHYGPLPPRLSCPSMRIGNNSDSLSSTVGGQIAEIDAWSENDARRLLLHVYCRFRPVRWGGIQ